jgi:hypothetical protein
MGQQQLLLLVLATVIVGLATVAGIQAFDEGQTQAAQDALQQRALTIGSDIYAATQQPTQLGGISDTESSASNIAAAAGYGESGDGDGTSIPADGAGESAGCDISGSTGGSDPITVTCTSNDNGSGSSANSSSNQHVIVKIKSDGPKVTSINGTDITSG